MASLSDTNCICIFRYFVLSLLIECGYTYRGCLCTVKLNVRKMKPFLWKLKLVNSISLVVALNVWKLSKMLAIHIGLLPNKSMQLYWFWLICGKYPWLYCMYEVLYIYQNIDHIKSQAATIKQNAKKSCSAPAFFNNCSLFQDDCRQAYGVAWRKGRSSRG